MQGVEILTSAQVAIEWSYNWIAFWWALGIVVVFVFMVGLLEANEPVLGLIIGVMFGLVLAGCCGALFRETINYETQYKVTVSDEVSMTEFYEHYEVIEQDGKIFTVREKDNNE